MDTPVQCDYPSYDCQTYFRRRYDMLRHKREYHQDTKQCPQRGCRYATKRQDRMTKHINKEHTVTLNVAMPQDSTFQQSRGPSQQIQPVYSNIPDRFYLPANDDLQAGAIAMPPDFNNTMGFDNDFNATQSAFRGMDNQNLSQTSFDAPAIDFNLPQLSDDLFAETAPAPEPSEQITLSIPNWGYGTFHYGNYDSESPYMSFDTNLTSTLRTSSDTSTFPYEASYPTQYGHYAVHAAALSVDTTLYDANDIFRIQYNNGDSNNFQPYGSFEGEGSQ